MNLLPGTEILGSGFDGLGKFDASGVRVALFKQGNDTGKTYQDPINQKVYTVLDNIVLGEDTDADSTILAKASRQAVQEALTVSAGIRGSYRGFSGEINALYSQSTASDESSFYGLYDEKINVWQLTLRSEAVSDLDPTFLNDPLVTGMPTQYDPTTRTHFFHLFQKFGTHYVAGVAMGGRLFYAIRIAQRAISDQTTFQANLKLEYDGVIASVGANASADWQRLGQTWASSRQVTINAVGGDASLLALPPPEFGANHNADFVKWTATIRNNPGILGLTLQPISVLFTGDQQTALEQALDDYQNSVVTAFAHLRNINGSNQTSSWGILKGGVPINPATQSGNSNLQSGFQIALFDSKVFNVIFGKLYLVPINPDTPLEPVMSPEERVQFYGRIMSDLNQVTETNYLAAVVGFALDAPSSFPTPEFAAWLTGVGASAGLLKWKVLFGRSAGNQLGNYLIVGFQEGDSSTASEAFTNSFGGNVDDRVSLAYFGDDGQALRAPKLAIGAAPGYSGGFAADEASGTNAPPTPEKPDTYGLD